MFYVFDMALPGVIFIKVSDFIKSHISVKKLGLTIIEDAEKQEMLQ